MSTLHIHLLGPPEVRYGGDLLSFRSAKALALLAYLAVERELQPRDTLAALFWPESDGSRARANLRNTLNYLRNALPRNDDGDTPHLIVERDALGFDATSDHFLDVAAVKVATETRRPGPLQRTLSLYRGDFLEGFSLDDAPQFDDWAGFQRERWHRHLGTIFERLAHHQAANSRIAAALETTTQWLAHDPLDEAAHRQMMHLLARDGRRHEALVQYERCRALLAEELGIEPDPRTTALYERIRQGTADVSPSLSPHPLTLAPAHNLPPPTTPFVGRDAERALLREYLDDTDTRLVTLTGPGGIGKTRLALQAARESIGRFLDGVWLAALEDVQDVEQLVTALADVLDVQFSGRVAPRAQLLSFLGEREMLLVLDNFEQLLPEGATFLADLLRQAPAVELLVTSRERLTLRPERVLALDGLPRPAAQTLFVTAARRADAAFTLEPEMEPDVSRICDLVGGLPLGLEMAAAWVRVLSPAGIAGELQGNLDLLATTMHDAPARHRSLRAVFDTSWQRLEPAEPAVLRALSIFHGGFTRAAAEAVAGASLSLLSALVDKSLVGRRARDRFALHPLFRAYAAEKLATRPGERTAVATRHSIYYLDWLAQQEPVLLQGERSDEAVFREIETDIDNVRAAWQTAVRQNQGHRAGKAALPLGIYYDLRGRLLEWRSLLGPAISQLEAEPAPSAAQEEALGRLLLFRGLVASRLGDQEQAQTILRRARAGLGATPAWRGLVLNYLAIVAIQQGRFRDGLALGEEALAHNQADGNVLGVGLAYNVLGITAGAVGDLAQACRYLERAVEQWRAVQSKHGEERALIHLGSVTDALGHPGRARAHLQTALALGEQINDRTLRPLALGHLGVVNYRQGRTEAARRHFRTALKEAAARQLSPFAFYAIGGLGLVAAQADEAETAVAILTFWQEASPGRVGSLRGEITTALAQLEAQMTPAGFAQAQARGRTLTIEMVLLHSQQQD